ncbi:ACT domain-containing protein [Yinghuangia sp. ASG 101]|uniref:ACT domain-containing protein n=1 Tax=Yinghuangia sp. ASG 101 TaxID=2896848 RepID=UPI001E29CFAE|nr:ACT domain-containing protein [Yinghuangia sp. ASG 101]UGQ09725.1 ACT domain-containing protein [Yinghuangia sp. ASG 101]
MLFRLRVSLPDRPGSLARITQTLGSAGADVLQMTVLERDTGRAIDEFTVSWPGDRSADDLTEGLSTLQGVRVEGCWGTGAVPGASPELDVLGQVARDPGRAVATLVDAAPGLFHADWAVATRGTKSRAVVHASWQAPTAPKLPLVSPLRPLALALDDAPTTFAAAAPIGLSWLTLFVVRTDGPAFHRTELERLGRLVDVVQGVLGTRTAPRAAKAPQHG